MNAANKRVKERHTKEVERTEAHSSGNLHWHAALRDCPSSIVVRITSLTRRRRSHNWPKRGRRKRGLTKIRKHGMAAEDFFGWATKLVKLYYHNMFFTTKLLICFEKVSPKLGINLSKYSARPQIGILRLLAKSVKCADIAKKAMNPDI